MKQFKVTYTLNGVQAEPTTTTDPMAVVTNLLKVAILTDVFVASLTVQTL